MSSRPRVQRRRSCCGFNGVSVKCVAKAERLEALEETTCVGQSVRDSAGATLRSLLQKLWGSLQMSAVLAEPDSVFKQPKVKQIDRIITNRCVLCCIGRKPGADEEPVVCCRTEDSCEQIRQ